MTDNLPAPRDEGTLVVDAVHDLHADHHDPQRQEVQQNLAVALMPLALVAFLVLSFAAAAWTFIAAQPGP